MRGAILYAAGDVRCEERADPMITSLTALWWPPLSSQPKTSSRACWHCPTSWPPAGMPQSRPGSSRV